MTREEQIRQASIEYTIKNRPMCIGGGAFSKEIDEMNRNYAFEEGAKWSDKEHGKELLYAIQKTGERTKREIINKACEWLENELFEDKAEINPYYDYDVKSKTYDFLKDFIVGFRKAMGE